MKKIAISLSIFAAALLAKTDINSIPSSLPMASYIVKEIGSGEVLMAKNMQKKIAPASLTKILTAIIAIESGKLDEYVTITRESTMVQPTRAGFKVGEEVQLLDLVKAALVNSSNDAATAVGIHISGSTEAFSALMNEKAKLMGMKNSHFTNACGFDIKDHYSTAEDLLKLSEHSIRNKLFNEIVKLDAVDIATKNTGKVYRLGTHNKLLDKYKYAIGVKTGFTNKAGKCLIARAKRDNKDVLVVMLKSKTDRWVMAENLFEKAFVMDRPEQEVIDNSEPTVGKGAKSKIKAYHASKNGSTHTTKIKKHKRLASQRASKDRG
jgi:serine-type D-Ala-D-Ala carboxypeptidase (penicillin-binding protein 5/6)